MLRQRRHENGNDSVVSFDWGSVVVSGLIFFALFAWTEFLLFPIRTELSTSSSLDRYPDDFNVEPEQEVGAEAEATALTGEAIISEAQFSQVPAVALAGQASRLASVSQLAKVKNMALLRRQQALQAKRRLHFLHSLILTLMAIVAVIVFNLYRQSRRATKRRCRHR